jgi:hypothetical protein
MLTPKDAYDALLSRNRLRMDDRTEPGRAPLRLVFRCGTFLLRVALAVSGPLRGLGREGGVTVYRTVTTKQERWWTE